MTVCERKENNDPLEMKASLSSSLIELLDGGF